MKINKNEEGLKGQISQKNKSADPPWSGSGRARICPERCRFGTRALGAKRHRFCALIKIKFFFLKFIPTASLKKKNWNPPFLFSGRVLNPSLAPPLPPEPAVVSTVNDSRSRRNSGF
ncbi:hypothetical protein V6Z11_A07G041600 [Gossypium hirsutum]